MSSDFSESLSPQSAASGAQVHFTGRKALTTYSSGGSAAKIFEPTNNCNLVGLGDYPNTSSISNAVNGTLDSIAIDAGVRLIIYSGANYGGSVVLDAVGPKVIYNDYNMKYNEEDDDGDEGHSNNLGMMLDEPHESNWNASGSGSLPLVNELSSLITGWDTSVMDPSGSGQTLSARFPSPTGNVNSIDAARIRSYEIGYAPSDVNAPMRSGANMHNWVGSFKIRSESTGGGGGGGATHRVNVTARDVDHWSWSLDGGPDTMMPPGSTYVDITIGGSASPPSSAPATPSGFTAAITAMNQPTDTDFETTLNWSAVSGATEYRLEYGSLPDGAGNPYSPDNSQFSGWTQLAVSGTTYSKTLGQGSYWWRVSAKNAAGYSSATAPVNIFFETQDDDDD